MRFIFWGGRTNILDWMYAGSDTSIRLDRKYALYELFQNLGCLKSEERKSKYNEFTASDTWQDLIKCLDSHQCPIIHEIPHALQNRKTIVQMDRNNNIVRSWDRAVDIRNAKGFHTSSILRACRGKLKSAYGFKWRFEDPD